MDSQMEQKKKKKQRTKKLQRRHAELPEKDDGVANGRNFQTEGKRNSSKGHRETDFEREIKTLGKPKKAKRKEKEDHGPSKKSKKSLKKGEADRDEVCHLSPVDEDCSKAMKGKSKKVKIKRKRDKDSSKEVEKSQEKAIEVDRDDVYQISSGDEDCTKGMRKWITEYHQSRPGLMILQQKIDEFITSHEAQLEQERKEREAQAAEGGWTVVVHHKGRKKTTDAESGTTVGSIAQAAVEDKMVKKKHKEVGLNFYRFQRREAQRNEIMMLQSKFEQDKKRIQQLRASRKFRPY
ncbi:hypothetical protein I3842_03G002400 [Carya illinoinensis]|uniref:Ribosomal RNA-processing protein 7 C-terminal domain-containing protein n=1 Tax=Carya illinoinensis TaxID=32201 RepID=A0A922FFW8_CARIL|nr:hypothetical protein I3842_03G002400 [Carya illinoinensis]